MSADDRTEALARQWQAECSTAAERAALALLRKDRRSLDAVLATHTAAQLAAVQRPLPLYHAAALGDWAEGITALAAAGVPPSTADALVQVEADSPLAEVLSKMTNTFVYPVSSNSGSDSDSDEEGGGIMWAPGGYFSAVGLAVATGHREVSCIVVYTSALTKLLLFCMGTAGQHGPQ